MPALPPPTDPRTHLYEYDEEKMAYSSYDEADGSGVVPFNLDLADLVQVSIVTYRHAPRHISSRLVTRAVHQPRQLRAGRYLVATDRHTSCHISSRIVTRGAVPPRPLADLLVQTLLQLLTGDYAALPQLFSLLEPALDDGLGTGALIAIVRDFGALGCADSSINAAVVEDLMSHLEVGRSVGRSVGPRAIEGSEWCVKKKEEGRRKKEEGIFFLLSFLPSFLPSSSHHYCGGCYR